MLRGLSLSLRPGRWASARSDASLRAVPTSLTSSLHQPPSHVTLQPAVRWRQGRWSGVARPRLPPPYPPPTSAIIIPPYPSLPLPLAVPQKARAGPVLVSEGSSGKADRVKKIPCPPIRLPLLLTGISCRAAEEKVPNPCETETTTSLKMQPQTRGSRADAIFEWNRSTAGGGGGNTEPSGRAKGPSAWCEAKIQGKKNPLQGAGGGGAVLLLWEGCGYCLSTWNGRKGQMVVVLEGGEKKGKREDRCSRILCCTTATRGGGDSRESLHFAQRL